jgi:nucleotide-binding universal stress UspA family protein
MFRRILLAYDGSDASTKACELALDLARRYGAGLTVLSVARAPEFGDEVETEAVIENSRAYHEKLLDTVRTRATASGIDATFAVRVGHPTEQIIAEAERIQADLVVLGHRGKTLFQRLRLGSVSKQVVQYADCPVLVVR